MYNKLFLGLGLALFVASGSVSAEGVTLEEYVNKVLEENNELAFQRLGVDISSEVVTMSQQEFDAQFKVSAMRTDTFVKNTTAEKLQRQSNAEYSSVDDSISLGIEKKARFGTTLAMSYEIERTKNSLQSAEGVEGDEVSSYVGVSIVQPLIKNFGSSSNGFAYKTSKIDAEKAQNDFKSRKSNIAREAVASYLDVQKAFHVLKARQLSVDTAEKLLEDTQMLVQRGRASEYDVLDIRATLAQRNAELSIAQQEYQVSLNRLQRLLPQAVDSSELNRAILPKVSPIVISMDSAFDYAMANRPDIANALLQLEKEKIQRLSVENENDPELNLVVSYGGNGLSSNESSSLDSALEGKYRTWSAGLEFNMPLGFDTTSSARRAALLKQQQSEIALTVLQRQVQTDLQQSYEVVTQVYQQLQQYKDILKNQKQRLEIDKEKARQGNISYMELMRRRDMLNDVQDKFIQSLFNYQKARYDFFYHQGTLLDEVGS